MATGDPTQHPGSHPGEQSGESGVETLTMTKEELNSLIDGKLKGSGKELKKAQERLALFEKAEADRQAAAEEAKREQMEEDGKKDELLSLERTEKDRLSQELNSLKEKEIKRIEVLNEKNQERVKNLPKEIQDLVPSQLSGDDLSDYLGRLESKIVDRKIPVFGAGGARMSGAPIDPFDRAKQVGHDFLFGRKGNQKK